MAGLWYLIPPVLPAHPLLVASSMQQLWNCDFCMQSIMVIVVVMV